MFSGARKLITYSGIIAAVPILTIRAFVIITSDTDLTIAHSTTCLTYTDSINILKIVLALSARSFSWFTIVAVGNIATSNTTESR